MNVAALIPTGDHQWDPEEHSAPRCRERETSSILDRVLLRYRQRDETHRPAGARDRGSAPALQAVYCERVSQVDYRQPRSPPLIQALTNQPRVSE